MDSNNEHGHKFDYSIITDNIILGSDFCNHRVCKLHSSEFKKLGVSSEISLRAELKEVPADELCTYTWLPVPDKMAPNQNQLAIGTSIIDGAVSSGQKIYVHCTHGHGRSPTLVVAYFIRFQGKSLEEAEHIVKEKRPEIHIEPPQREALVEFAKRWSK